VKSFKQYIAEMKLLAEKVLIVGKGKKYGQIIFLAGGAGSGKGFTIGNFLEGEKFKVRDVDEFKKMFLKIDALKKKYPEIRGLDLTKPTDTYKLHQWIEDKKIKEKTLDNLVKFKDKGRLPNIIFDTTAADEGKITKNIPHLLEVGYDPKNINLVWVLTNYSVAIKQNRNPDRGRVVPENIMLKTHEGAANTIWNFINKGTPKEIDGGVYIILGGPENTILWTDSKGKPIKTGKKKDTVVVKDFQYITVKQPGKRMTSSKDLMAKVLDWIRNNIPRSDATKHFFGSGQDKKEGKRKR
tara:strand:+ start:207 stop:1097 length:891 start_codon:yes stop_codon:yes gene_type:complete